VTIETIDLSENNNLKAALEAIKEVYGFPFVFDKNNPELAIGNGAAKYTNADLIILTNGLQSTSKNVVTLHENPKSGNVFRAELPTQILEILLTHYQLVSPKNNLSRQQLKDIFKEKTITNHKDKTLIDKYLCILFLGIVLIERWISLKNNK
jgi:deoxyribodipyrimidine photolyase